MPAVDASSNKTKAVKYARLANSVLLWMEEDEKGNLREAMLHLEDAHRLMNELGRS